MLEAIGLNVNVASGYYVTNVLHRHPVLVTVAGIL